jgi:hypothetical protein
MLLILAGVLYATNVRWCDNFRDKYYSGTKKLPGQDRQDRATKTNSQLGQPGQVWHDRIVETGQQIRTARRGLPGQDGQVRTGRAGLLGQDSP